ncbi:MAG: FimV/HubP family polar landmark protein [Aeromonas sp.]
MKLRSKIRLNPLTVALLALGVSHMSLAAPFAVSLTGPAQPSAATALLAPSSAASTVSTPRYGPIHAADTLWSLANKYRPSPAVSVYQTMLAIFEKNRASFADGNINHLLVGASLVMPTVAEASVVSDAVARARFKADNAEWRQALKPKYRPASAKPSTNKASTATSTVAITTAPKAPVTAAAPLPSAVSPPTVSTAVPAVSVTPNPALDVDSDAAASALPAPTATRIAAPATEMALALEDANAQLTQVTEINQRLKSQVQNLSQEVESLKTQVEEQGSLEKELAELKASGEEGAAALPAAPSKASRSDLFSSPLNVAMLILLPLLLLLALVSFWLRNRTRPQTLETVTVKEDNAWDAALAEATGRDAPVAPEATAAGLSAVVAAAASMASAPAASAAQTDTDAAAPASPDVAAEADAAVETSAPASSDMASEVISEAPIVLSAQALQQSEELMGEAHSDAVDSGSVPVADSVLETEATSAASEAQVSEPSHAEHVSSRMSELFNVEKPASGASTERAEFASPVDTSDYAFTPVLPHAADVRVDEPMAFTDYAEVLSGASLQGISGQGDGCGSKLDLARGYLEISDRDSAYALLKQVLVEGNDHQRGEAQKLLEKIG